MTTMSAAMASVAGQYQTGPLPAGNRSKPVAVLLSQAEHALPLNTESLHAVCGEPTMPREDCPTCRELPESCDRFEKGGDLVRDTIPPAAAALRPFIELGEQVKTEWIARCSKCHRLYFEELTYEYLFNGSEDSHGYRRVDVAAVAKSIGLDRGATGELHRLATDLWRVVRD